MKLTVANKLTLVACTVGLIALLVVAHSIITIREATEFNSDLSSYKESMATIGKAKELQLQVANVWQFITDASLTKDKSVIEKEARPNLENAHASIDKLIKAHRGEGAGELEILRTIKSDLDKMWDSGNRMFNAYIQDWDKGNIAMDEYDKIGEKLIREVAEKVKEDDAHAEVMVREMIEMTNQAQKTSILFGTIVIIVSLASIIAIFIIKSSIVKPLRESIAAAEAIAEGDMSCRLESSTRDDELGQLMSSLCRMSGNLKSIIEKISLASNQVASASEEMSATAEEMVKGMDNQTTQTSQVASAMEEMSATVLEVAKNAQGAASTAREATATAKKGGEVVAKTVQGMQRIAGTVQKSARTIGELGKSSDQIGEIVAVIDDIADQTNLLALNAAIEAARAGEQGRGFAVVADEVRKLAEKTTKATKEIATMIKNIQKETEGAVNAMEVGTREVADGVRLANQAGDSLNMIIASIAKVNEMITQIATAAEQQSSAAEEISSSIEKIASVTRETTEGSRQTYSATYDLSKMATELRTLVGSFKV